MEVRRADPDAEWDAWLVERGTEADFLQTSRWAAIDRAANRRASVVLRAGERAGALFSKASAGGGELISLHGPVFPDRRELGLLPELLAAAETLASETGCVALRFVGRPPLSVIPAGVLADAFSEAGYAITPWSTAVIDLRQDDESLQRSFDYAARKAIKRCAREGVSFRVCGDFDSFERDFLLPFASVASPEYEPDRDRIAFRLDAGRAYSYQVAVSAGGEVLATLGTYRFAGVATEIMSARTEAGRSSGLPAQDFLHWAVMRRHSELGDKWFDVGGYAAVPSTAKEAGIRRFKEKWGGEPVVMPIFVKPLTGRFHRLARRLLERVA